MKRAVRINATMDEELLRRLDAFAESQYEDRSTAIRQLVGFALRELSQRDAVEAYRAGRLTIREFARALGLDVWGAHDLLATLKVPVAQGSRGESRAGFERLLESLGRKKKARPNKAG